MKVELPLLGFVHNIWEKEGDLGVVAEPWESWNGCTLECRRRIVWCKEMEVDMKDVVGRKGLDGIWIIWLNRNINAFNRC